MSFNLLIKLKMHKFEACKMIDYYICNSKDLMKFTLNRRKIKLIINY